MPRFTPAKDGEVAAFRVSFLIRMIFSALVEGLSLNDIDFIKFRDDDEVAGVLKAFHDNGVTHVPDGRKVEDLVVTKVPNKEDQVK